ncbi:MAG: DUF4012 domain-containing protein [Candidatus Kerfeldbacteria bacterium]|nr:DUF4012 domain-containing protein [Candidatus Kerfeldbacteria bacterium]
MTLVPTVKPLPKPTQAKPTPLPLHKRFKHPKALLAMIGVLAVLAGFGFIAVQAKQMYQAGVLTKNEVLLAQQAVTAKDWPAAKDHLVASQTALQQVQQASGRLAIIKWLPWIKTQFQAVDSLTTAGVHGLAAANAGIELADDILSTLDQPEVSFSSLTGQQRKQVLQTLTDSPQILANITTEMDAAVTALDTIPTQGLIKPLAVVITPIQQRLPEFRRYVDDVLPFLQVAPTVVGYPDEQTYLFLLQNNTELRPTGGFIGSYGILILKNGDIKDFKTDNIYNIDNPVKNELFITPPAPLQQYLGSSQWFMRDANWHPDFPTTAEKVEEFYHLEHGPVAQIDGVIAVTPDVIKALLEFTGPITIEGDEYSSANLTELLQEKVEVSFRQEGRTDATRKEVIGHLAGELMQRLQRAPRSQWPDLLSTVLEQLEQKQILLFSKNTAVQNLVAQLDWDGALQTTTSDYVQVVDANLAALKTDRVMEKQFSYALSKDGESYSAKLTLQYHNAGVGYTSFTTRYRSYTRIYVPLGSELISTTGFLSNDCNIGCDPVSAKITQDDEFARTIFEGFIAVEPQDTATVTLTYKLPANISAQIEDGTYQLYWQKQSGTNNVQIETDYSAIDKNSIFDKNTLHFNGPLHTDQTITLNSQ